MEKNKRMEDAQERISHQATVTPPAEYRRNCLRVTNDEYYVLEYPDWINVIAITETDQMVCASVSLYAQHHFFLVPAGVIEKKKEPFEQPVVSCRRTNMPTMTTFVDDGAIYPIQLPTPILLCFIWYQMSWKRWKADSIWMTLRRYRYYLFSKEEVKSDGKGAMR